MKIALIYNKEEEYTTGSYIEKVIKDAGIDYQHFWTEKSSDIPKNFALYFRIDHGDYTYDIPEHLHPAIFYVIDTHLKKPYKKIKRQAKHYDVIFCAQKQGAKKLKKQTRIDTQWVPLGCDPQIHKKLDIPKKYDIGFVGRDAKKFPRGRQLEILKKKYPNSYIGIADHKEMSDIYSASKIGFNSPIRNDINMRMFEILSCGCFLLTYYIKDNGFDELFEDGKHLVTFKSNKEMIKLIDYYLKYPEEREKIAEQGYKLVVDKYTYTNTVQKMFNYIAFKYGGKYNKLRI